MGDKLKKSKLNLDKSEVKLEKAQGKIPKKKVGKRLYEKEKPKVKLDFTESRAKTPSKLVDKPKPSSNIAHNMKKSSSKAMVGKLHSEAFKNEDDNVGVKSAHNASNITEFTTNQVTSVHHNHKLKPYKNLAKAEKGNAKAEINHTFQKKMSENPTTNPLSRWQQKRAIKKQYANAHRVGTQTQHAVSAVEGVAKKGADVTVNAVSSLVKNPKVLLIIACAVLVFILIAGAFSACSLMFQGGISAIVSASYTSGDEDIVAVDNSYKGLEDKLQTQIDNIESDYPNYDKYRYDLATIAHSSHELASYLTSLLQTYQPNEVDIELQKIFDLQYLLEIESEVEIRYRTETRTDSEGNSYTIEVPYAYHILNVTLTSTTIKKLAETLLTAEQEEHFKTLLETSGNKPDIFGGRSSNTDDSTDLSGVEFIDGERAGDQGIVDIAKSQVGNVGGEPYWSWYGFDSRVEWCATYVSWVLDQAGYSEPKFSACTSQGMPYFQTRGRWENGNFRDIAAGDIIFFDWNNSGNADHVGIVIGTDGSRVYTIEGNSGDACHIRDYSLDSSVIRGYGLMN